MKPDADPETGTTPTPSAELQPGRRLNSGRLSDQQLLILCRAGEVEGYAELFRRHHPAAVAMAARTSTRCDPGDAAAEAFTRVWQAIRNGGGPTTAFRSYLCSTVRNVALNTTTRSHEVPADPGETFDQIRAIQADPDELATGSVMGGMIAEVFKALPERWRQVLWLTVVEGRPVIEAAVALGISANATSALAMRAREGLRQSWLLHQQFNHATEHCVDTGETTGCCARCLGAA